MRNAIAHGKVRLIAQQIAFGATHPTTLAPFEFLDLFDRLVRVSNGIAAGTLLFLIRNSSRAALFEHLPPAILVLFAAGAINRTGCRVTGAVESETPLAGRQLHVAINLADRHRAQVLGQCGRIAYQLLQAGARGYDRLVCEVEHGEPVGSLVIVRLPKLQELLATDADAHTIAQAFDETQLLWYDESPWRVRLRAWRLILRSAATAAQRQILDNWHNSGLWVGKGRYSIRDVKNLSVDGLARVHVYAVLTRASDADDRTVLNEVVRELVKWARRRRVRSRQGALERGIPWPKPPVHVFVDVYRRDGTLRWLTRGGWPAGNLVAVAERVWGRRAPARVTNPQAIHRGIRIRYATRHRPVRRPGNRESGWRSASQQLLGHPSRVARPLRSVNLRSCNGTVEQHEQRASHRFRVLHSCRRRPFEETLREPLALTMSNSARRVRGIGEFGHRMLQRAPAEIL